MTPQNLGIDDKQLGHLIDGEYLVRAELSATDSTNKKQTLNYQITGLHPRACTTALRRLQLYENYENLLGFVKKSQYVESEQEISLELGHTLLPFDMLLVFNIPRIKQVGIYPFGFDRGFLRGLTGEIHVQEYRGRCLFHSTANWTGPHTGISETVFSLFASTLSRIAMGSLFRASMTP